jgi:hypothetical protein
MQRETIAQLFFFPQQNKAMHFTGGTYQAMTAILSLQIYVKKDRLHFQSL